MSSNHYIYSIGYGLRKMPNFITLLKEFKLNFVLDIRSVPYSKWNPVFCQNELKVALSQQNIRYVYLGNELGAKPKDLSCYTNGQLSYSLLKEKPYFKAGFQRLITANQKRVKVAVMCNKYQPHECHRTRLVGKELLAYGISMQHIIEKSLVKDQQTVMAELTKGKNVIDLFGNEII